MSEKKALEAGSTSVPRTVAEAKRLIVNQDVLWEYRVFVGYLVQGKDELEQKWHDHEIRYVRPTGAHLDDVQSADFIQKAVNEVSVYTRNLERTLDQRAQEPAFGPPGTPGDPIRIEHLAKRFIRSYEDLMDWASRIRGTQTPDRFQPVFELAATLVDRPLSEIRAFINDAVDKVEHVPELLANARGERALLDLSIVLTMDEQILQEFSKETARLAADLRQHPPRRR
jgi:hypothetical protein